MGLRVGLSTPLGTGENAGALDHTGDLSALRGNDDVLARRPRDVRMLRRSDAGRSVVSDMPLNVNDLCKPPPIDRAPHPITVGHELAERLTVLCPGQTYCIEIYGRWFAILDLEDLTVLLEQSTMGHRCASK